jgi:DNA polymerase elongation subunit (family B)
MVTKFPTDVIAYNGKEIGVAGVPSLLFIDLECAVTETYSELSDQRKKTWAKRAARIRGGKSEKQEMSDAELYEAEGGLYDEFSRIICIGLGKLSLVKTDIDGVEHFSFRKKLRVISNDDEALLLKEVAENYLSKPHLNFKFCGFNIHNFDMPFLRNRMHINKIPIPITVRAANGKPWNSNTLDLMIYWQENNHRPYVGLDDLCLALGVPTPKDLCNNKDVQSMWREGRIEEIKTYCSKDVASNMEIMLRLLNAEQMLED